MTNVNIMLCDCSADLLDNGKYKTNFLNNGLLIDIYC